MNAKYLKIFSLIFVLPFIIFDFLYSWFIDISYNKYHEFFVSFTKNLGPISNSSLFSDSSVGWCAKLSSMPWAHRLLGMLVDIVSLGLFLWGFFVFLSLLSSYQKGVVFSQESFFLLKKLSKISFVWVLYSPIKDTLLSVICTLHNPPGQRIITVSFSSRDIYHIFFVGVIFVITSLIYEGYIIKKEQDLII
jgi:hypothetical protein